MDTLYKQIDEYRRIWHDRKLDDYDFILILPNKDSKLNTRIRTAFEQKLNGRSGEVIEGTAARELVRLYELYEFSGKVIIGSFNEPYGRKLRNLIDCGIADEGVLINDVILGAL